MPEPVKVGRKERMSFSKIKEVAEMPNLIEIQTESYDWFVREGLQEVFEDISPIKKFLSRIPILRNLVKSVEKIMKKYDSIAQNVDEISKKITAMRMLALRDNNALQVMFDNNILYGQQIEELIIAGKIKIEEFEMNYH